MVPAQPSENRGFRLQNGCTTAIKTRETIRTNATPDLA